MSESLQYQTTLIAVKRVAAASVPVPGDGPVLFSDSSNSNALTVKHPDGTTKVVFGVAAAPEVLGDPGANEALINLLAALETLGLIVDSTA